MKPLMVYPGRLNTVMPRYVNASLGRVVMYLSGMAPCPPSACVVNTCGPSEDDVHKYQFVVEWCGGLPVCRHLSITFFLPLSLFLQLLHDRIVCMGFLLLTVPCLEQSSSPFVSELVSAASSCLPPQTAIHSPQSITILIASYDSRTC